MSFKPEIPSAQLPPATLSRGGRPPSKHCPKCVEEGVDPPRVRKAPGQPCEEHKRAYMRDYMKGWNKSRYNVTSLIKVLEDLQRWVAVGEFEEARVELKSDLEVRKPTYGTLESLFRLRTDLYDLYVFLTLPDDKWEEHLVNFEAQGYRRRDPESLVPVETIRLGKADQTQEGEKQKRPDGDQNSPS